MRIVELFLFSLAWVGSSIAAPPSSPEIPLVFAANAGQTVEQDLYTARNSHLNVAFRRGEVAFRLPGTCLRMRFLGAKDVQPVGIQRLSAQANFLTGGRDHWRTGVPLYAGIQYSALYPGVDLFFASDKARLKSDFVVSPGADPGAIRIRYIGPDDTAVRAIAIESDGSLSIHADGEIIHEGAPVVYQHSGGRSVHIEARFVSFDDGSVGFAVERYDPSLPLIIDPVITYSTFLGGSGIDAATAVAVDSTGSTYITGFTDSANFPTANPARNFNAGGNEVFIAKLNPSGNSLMYCTYIGGAGDDRGYGIAVDAVGSAYVTGWTASQNFPVQLPLQSRLAGLRNAFVLKLNPAGNTLQFSTYLGGNAQDSGNAIALDAGGNLYIAGDTTSINFPNTGFQRGNRGGSDAFITKISGDGARLLYSTYLGGSGNDRASGIVVGPAGNAYVTGSTSSTDFPVRGAFQNANAGGQDAFLTKLSSDGTALMFSTYLGGAGGTVSYPEAGQAIAMDTQENTYVAGVTSSINFPVSNAFRSALSGQCDAFVAKFDKSGNLAYSTYFGGSGIDVANGIAVDSNGSAWVVGYTYSTDLPVLNALQSFPAGDSDAFLVQLSPNGGSSPMTTYVGGSGADSATAIAIDTSGNVSVVGFTQSTNFPLQNPLQSTNGGSFGGFAAKFVQPGLSILCSHVGTFVSGGIGRYIITVTPVVSSTSGTVAVTDALPAGMTLTSMSGSGWTCLGNTCSRSDVISPGSSYTIDVVVSVSASASGQLVNVASVSGGGSPPRSVNDVTTIAPASPIALVPANAATGVPLSCTLAWSAGAGATSYDVYFGTTSSPQFVGNTTSTTYSVGPLNSVTTYYWQVISKNGSATGPSPVQFFTTTSSNGNLALGKTATESSTYSGYGVTAPASFAVDGNTDGNFYHLSLSVTNADSNAWWQVDLGGPATVNSIAVWNRTDCCASWLSDYWVFVSNTPFSAADTLATLQNRAGTWSSHQTSFPNPTISIPLSGVTGRYVRIQLSGTGYLALAEVQVFGVPITPCSNCTISGRVMLSGTSIGLSGATVSLSGGYAASTGTDAAGNYSFSNVPAGSNVSVGVSRSGFTLAPSSVSFSNLSVNQVANFVATGIPVNLSQGKTASESSTYSGYGVTAPASFAVDGNTDGNFYHLSLSVTYSDPNAWWQVDLGGSAVLNSIAIWNRTDCCAAWLTDYWVFVSDTPFNATDTPATLQNRAGTWSSHQTSFPNPTISIPLSGVIGRYVRIQLAGTGYLALAEVQVIGALITPAQPCSNCTISGRVMLSGTSIGLSGATVSLSGGYAASTGTDAAGNYSFSNVPAGSNVSVGVSRSGFTLAPSSVSFSNLSVNQVANFVATGIPVNLSQGKTASESSTYSGYGVTAPASFAVDGNTDGNFYHLSLSVTYSDPNAWWQVDLGGSAVLNSIAIWNRTDCCAAWLTDYWVFVSDTPFNATDTPATLQNRAGTWSSHQTSFPNPTISIPLSGVIGRYVRIQLAGTGYLALAEVQVIGALR
jgi:hypothetical protein